MKILFIGARLFNDVASYAKKEGIKTILTESNPDSPNLKLSDVHYLVSRGMEKPKEIAIKEDVDAVVPLIGVDEPLLEVARMKKELESTYGIPVVASGIDAVKISTDKLKTKEFFVNNGIETPQFSKVSKNGFEFEYPMVLKKLKGQGGSGIKIASSWRDFENYFSEFNDGIAEKFVEGTEISVETLRWRGKSVPLTPVYKGKTTFTGIHPLNKIKKAPLEIEGFDNQYIRKLADRITNLLGVEGIADIDFIFEGKTHTNFVIEINTRPSGTRYITTASTNINPMHELVNMSTGKWDVNKIKREMKEYAAVEIPIGNYRTTKNNFQLRDFPTENCWIIHGPENSRRITIRAGTIDGAFRTARRLNIDFSKYGRNNEKLNIKG